MLMNASCFGNLFDLKLPVHRVTLSTINIVSAIMASSLNFLIILSIWRTPSLHKPSNILLANLAITDFLVGTIVQPLLILTNFASLENWVQVFCYCWIVGRVFGYWFCSTSLFTLVVISVDRLLAILLKNRYRAVVTVRRVIIALLLWWLGAGLIILSVVTATEIHYEIYFTVLAIVMFAMLGTIILCYTLSFRILKKMSSPVMPAVQTGEENPPAAPPNFRPMKYRRLLITMVLLLFTTFLFYTPYVCSVIAAVITHVIYLEQPDVVYDYYRVPFYRFLSLSELIVGINSTVNPLLYLWRMKKLRDSVGSTVRMILKKEQSQQRPDQTQDE
ncbi:hypothetical protein QZH41_003334 [Actinostola sp. cb2023]|nr:hypothetical protein QZH41_003334 [Actinostola sp. cb2023]